MKELIEKLNNLQIHQTKSEWEDDIPEDIWNEHLEGKYTTVEYELDVDKHRHYEIATDVLEFENFILGVRYISNLYSEESDYGDCYHHLQFFEMEEFATIAYRAKKG